MRPVAIGLAKRVIDATARPALSTTLELEVALQTMCAASQDFAEGAQAFAEKRQPSSPAAESGSPWYGYYRQDHGPGQAGRRRPHGRRITKREGKKEERKGDAKDELARTEEKADAKADEVANLERRPELRRRPRRRDRRREARPWLIDLGEELVVIANTGDDIEIHGARVSPDPDLILYWLAERIDARGWGIAGDTFHAMDGLRARGEDVWFNLGDEDLEICRDRLRAPARRRAAHRDDRRAARAARRAARVLPMCDEPAPTFVDGTPFQEWMIRHGGTPGEVVLDGRRRSPPRSRAAMRPPTRWSSARATPSSRSTRSSRMAGMREALAAKPSSPSARSSTGEVLKGPTAAFLPTPRAVVALLRRPGRRLGHRTLSGSADADARRRLARRRSSPS